jgi:hypothetical protein
VVKRHTWGGKRARAGRPLIYGERTKNMKVPVSRMDDVRRFLLRGHDTEQRIKQALVDLADVTLTGEQAKDFIQVTSQAFASEWNALPGTPGAERWERFFEMAAKLIGEAPAAAPRTEPGLDTPAARGLEVPEARGPPRVRSENDVVETGR